VTVLTRRVRRSVSTRFRPLVVMLHPGAEPTIELREKGRRSGFTITLASLFVVLAERAAAQAIAERKARRKARRAAA